MRLDWLELKVPPLALTVGAAIVMVVVPAAFGRTTSVRPEVAIPIGIAAALAGLYLQKFQIHPEERILQRRFGDAFNVYLGQVRRWL